MPGSIEIAPWRETGEVAYERDFAVRLTLDDERIVRIVARLADNGATRKSAPVRVPPGLAIMANEFAGRPFGIVGEMATPRPPKQLPPRPPLIPPPPWSNNYSGEETVEAQTEPAEPETLARPTFPPPNWAEEKEET